MSKLYTFSVVKNQMWVSFFSLKEEWLKTKSMLKLETYLLSFYQNNWIYIKPALPESQKYYFFKVCVPVTYEVLKSSQYDFIIRVLNKRFIWCVHFKALYNSISTPCPKWLNSTHMWVILIVFKEYMFIHDLYIIITFCLHHYVCLSSEKYKQNQKRWHIISQLCICIPTHSKKTFLLEDKARSVQNESLNGQGHCK